MSSKTLVWSALALICASGAVFLGWHHPVSALACLLGLAGVIAACLRWQQLWLFLVPACLPWLNFAPWTGWILIEEFDLLVIGVLAAGYARLAMDSATQPPGLAGLATNPGRPAPGETMGLWLVLALVLSSLVSLARGVLDAGGLRFDWYQTYVDPLNSLRAAKALVFSVMLLPLLRQAAHSGTPGFDRKPMLGVVAGLGVVLVIVLWERMAFPGLVNFSAVYRVTAWFWEMHVGGAAIDAYLALTGPFVLLFWVKARSRTLRGLAAILLFLLAYAVLVTFSRGLYAAAVVSVLVFVLVIGLARRADSSGNLAPVSVAHQATPSRMRRVALPLVAVGVVGWLALGADSFLVNRLLNTERVLAGRLKHWAHAIALVRTPADWLFGVGLGRFPARYATNVADGDFSGAAHVSARATGDSGGRTFVTLQGPVATDEKGGLFALTQRISPAPGARYVATGKYRAAVEAELVLQVCERHLLYNWNCQEAGFQTDPHVQGWRDFSLILQGERFSTPALQVPRLAFFTMSVVNAGGQTDLTDLQLAQGEQAGLLVNADFSAGAGRWFPAAQYYFEPWHADSLWLDLLVERGLAGLLAFAALFLAAAMAAFRLYRRDRHYAACLSASLAGVLVVGMVSSVLDVPRVAFLLHFVMFYGLVRVGQPSGSPVKPEKVQPEAPP